jgi:hypothetical protein
MNQRLTASAWIIPVIGLVAAAAIALPSFYAEACTQFIATEPFKFLSH